MSIIRIQKRDNPFVQIDKRPLEESRLSWRAKGILAYLLSKPDGWEVRSEDVLNHGTEGRDAVRAAFQELKAFGYAELVTHSDEKSGKMTGKSWVIRESPSDALISRPPEKPSVGKTPPSNNDWYSNNQKKKEEESLTLPFSSETFKAAWTEWKAYRKQKKSPLPLMTQKKQLQKLASWTEEEAVFSLSEAIEQGWTGFFAPKAQGSTQTNRMPYRQGNQHKAPQNQSQAPRNTIHLNELHVILMQWAEHPPTKLDPKDVVRFRKAIDEQGLEVIMSLADGDGAFDGWWAKYMAEAQIQENQK